MTDTIDWLLKGDASFRWQAMRDLLEESPEIYEKNPAPDPTLEGADISGLSKGTTQCLVGLRINHEEILKNLTSGKYSIIWKSGDLQSNEVIFDWNGTTITTIDN